VVYFWNRIAKEGGLNKMSSIGKVSIVVVFVVIVYLLMLVLMPIFTDLASTANNTMASTSNVSNYPGAQEGIVAAPLLLWFVPAGIGGIAVVLILKKTK